MKDYATKDIKNVCLIGHGHSGKTMLAEAMLYTAKVTDRFGKVNDGNTVCDYDAEEIKRKISISTAVAPLEWKGQKINLIDTPGFFDFAGEVLGGTRVADTAIITVSGKSGIHVGTGKAVKYAHAQSLPKMFFITKLDEENADFFKVLDALRDAYGKAVCPLNVPVYQEGRIIGYADVVSGVAQNLDKAGKLQDIPVPDDVRARMDEYRTMINEAIAQTSDDLMEKFFADEPFTHEEFVGGIKQGIIDSSLIPVLGGSGTTAMGVITLLDFIAEYMPGMVDRPAPIAEDQNGDPVEVACDPQASTALFIFKTVADPFVGKMSYFKVMSGTLKADMTLVNARSGATDKLSHIYLMTGKKQSEVKSLTCGDIGAVSKLASAQTGDTLCTAGHVFAFPPLDFPHPCFSMAITPKAKGDEEKIAQGLHRLIEEDPTVRYTTNKETHEQILSGMGEQHLDVVVSKLASKFGVAASLQAPKVAYRETIRKKVKAEGKHKKQSGGHGQYGHVIVEFEPNPDEMDLVFEEKVFGGSVPKNFFPAVEKGLRDCIGKGVLAGYPVVNLKATLLDGSYHPVDSSEMAFKLAASLAYKAGLEQANPVLLEPIGSLKVQIPEELMGDIIGGINKRRGRVIGMNPAGEGMTEVEAEVPVAEMADYANALRSMTRGTGSFDFDFVRYEQAPEPVAKKVIEAHAAQKEA